MNDIQHILISRTDNLGDVVLTLPLAGILKGFIPGVKITFLAREYAHAIIEHCRHIDAFLSWDTLSQLNTSEAISDIQSHHFDAVLHVFPHKQIAKLMRRATVRYRIGTSRRLFHWWTCNKFVNFSRAKSDLHEAQLNTVLLKPLGVEKMVDLNTLSEKMGFYCDEPLSQELQTVLKPNVFHLMIHPFTNGHTIEWPVSHFNALIRQLPADRVQIIITGSAKESEAIQIRIVSQCPKVTNLAGQCSLREFIQLIAHCDGFIANSTGPLHIAAALGVRTLGLFPVRKGIDVNRWGPIGKKTEVLIADPECQSPLCRGKNDCLCMESITVSQVKDKVLSWLESEGEK